MKRLALLIVCLLGSLLLFAARSVKQEGDASAVPLHAYLAQDYPAPLTFSLPFAPGTLESVSAAHICDGTKIPPQQWSILNKWPDGSIKWAQVTCPPPVEGYSLVVGTPGVAVPDSPVALHLTRSPGEGAISSIEARSGDFSFSLDRTTSTVNLSLTGHSGLSFLVSELVAEDGAVLPADIDKIEIVEEGPLRSVLRATGYHRSEARPRGRGFGRFDIFFTLLAGAKYVEIDHALAPQDENPEENRIREMQRFRSASIPVRFAGGDSAPTAFVSESQTIEPGRRLFQYEDYAWTLDGAPGKGERAEGVLLAVPESANAGAPVAYAAVRDFWQQWPKAFTVAPGGDGFNIDLYPTLTLDGKNPYADRENEQIWYYYLRSGSYEVRQGVEKSHRVFIGWADTPEAARASALAIQTLPVVLPSLDYVNATQVEDPMLPPMGGGLFDDWDRAFLEATQSYFTQQEQNRWYGLLNWGDWYGERRYNWCNHEYDLPTNLFRQALRFQNPEFFREAVRQTNHLRDIDIVNYHVDPARQGLKWKHSIGHTGGYYTPESGTHMKLPNGGRGDDEFFFGTSTPGHTRVTSFFLNHELTGDRRSLEAGRKVSDRLLETPLLADPNHNYYTAREPGWTLVGMASAWRATGDKRYLAAINRLADNILAKADGHGVWMRPLRNNQTAGDVKTGELSFMVAFQTAGMIEAWKITGREDIRDNIIAAARYAAANLYRPEYRAFVHSPSRTRVQTPRAGGLAGNNLRYIMAYACTLDPSLVSEFREPILDSFASTAANRQWVGTKQDPDRPYPHDITSAFYSLNPDQVAMKTVFGSELKNQRDEILSRGAPASVFPPTNVKWEDERIGD